MFAEIISCTFRFTSTVFVLFLAFVAVAIVSHFEQEKGASTQNQLFNIHC